MQEPTEKPLKCNTFSIEVDDDQPRSQGLPVLQATGLGMRLDDDMFVVTSHS